MTTQFEIEVVVACRDFGSQHQSVIQTREFEVFGSGVGGSAALGTAHGAFEGAGLQVAQLKSQLLVVLDAAK